MAKPRKRQYKSGRKRKTTTGRKRKTKSGRKRKTTTGRKRKTKSGRKRKVVRYQGGLLMRNVKGRKSPAASATNFSVGTRRMGKDRHLWEVMITSNGTRRWKRLMIVCSSGMCRIQR